MTRRTQEAALLTLEQVANENAVKHWVYVRNSKHKAYSPYYPADYLANRVKASDKFHTIPIENAVERILRQKNQYPRAHIPYSTLDPRVESWRGGDYIQEDYSSKHTRSVMQQNPIRVSIIRDPGARQATFSKDGQEIGEAGAVSHRIQLNGIPGERFQLAILGRPEEIQSSKMPFVGLDADGVAKMVVEDQGKRYLVRVPLSEISNRLLISKDLDTAAYDGKLDLLFQRKAGKMQNLPRLVGDYERIFEGHFRSDPARRIGERVDIAGKATGGLSSRQMMKVVRTFHRTELAERFQPTRRITFADLKNKYQLSKVEIVFTRDAAGKLTMTRYDDATRLGEGSFGIAYRVAQLDLNQFLAAKKVKPLSSPEMHKEAIEGLRNEVAILREIHQNGKVQGIQDAPHVFQVIEEGPTQQALYSSVGTAYDGNATELITSPSWKTAPLRVKMECCRQILEGNKRLAELNILHVDQKPDNVFYRKVGTQYEVVTADFGGAFKGSNATPGRVVHTPKYLPVMEGLQGADARTVVYNVGATLFNFLSNGADPWPLGYPSYPGYPNLTDANAFNMHALTSQHVPEPVCQLIRQMCDPDPSRRPTASAAYTRWLELMATV